MRDEGKYVKHEAFGSVSVSRVSSNRATPLFMTHHRHHNFVQLTISEAEVKRDLAQEWMFRDREIIAIYMSESQWATMLTSMNQGGGSPCTIYRRSFGRLETMEDPPDSVGKTKTYAEELERYSEEGLDKTKGAITIVKSLLEKGKANKSDLSGLLDLLENALSQATGNVGFVAEQFEKNMERQVADSKMEVEGYANGLMSRMAAFAIRDTTTTAERDQLIRLLKDANQEDDAPRRSND